MCGVLHAAAARRPSREQVGRVSTRPLQWECGALEPVLFVSVVDYLMVTRATDWLGQTQARRSGHGAWRGSAIARVLRSGLRTVLTACLLREADVVEVGMGQDDGGDRIRPPRERRKPRQRPPGSGHAAVDREAGILLSRDQFAGRRLCDGRPPLRWLGTRFRPYPGGRRGSGPSPRRAATELMAPVRRTRRRPRRPLLCRSIGRGTWPRVGLGGR